jgi:hypothetical protein
VVQVVAVSQGNVYYANAGDAGWNTATNNTGNTPPLNFTGVVFSAENNQKLWFADGTNYCYYDARLGTVEPWAASAGTLPIDSSNNAPRLIETWRGRTVVSGLVQDPQNWFMSAVNNPTDFDYAPLSVSPTQAVAGNNSPQGLVGDAIMSMAAYSDDVLVFFGTHSIWLLRGDPMTGGQIDLVSDIIGGAWGRPWCKDPYGNLYFFSSRCGIYSLRPGEQPQRVSQQVDQLLASVDTGLNGIRLAWDDRFQGLHVFVTPYAAAGACNHLFYEWRTGAWWVDTFANNNHNPLALCVFDGNLPGDRAVLLGSWDGYVRKLDPAATTDDGTNVASQVTIGPILSAEQDTFLLKDLQAVLSESSNSVSFEVLVGDTPEIALASTAVASGTWLPSRNLLSAVRASGHALYVRITATSPWALEQIRCRFAGKGKVRRRLTGA